MGLRQVAKKVLEAEPLLLRERLAVLYGTRAVLDLESSPGAGFTARLILPGSDDQ